jgi:hypothetical protein
VDQYTISITFTHKNRQLHGTVEYLSPMYVQYHGPKESFLIEKLEVENLMMRSMKQFLHRFKGKNVQSELFSLTIIALSKAVSGLGLKIKAIVYTFHKYIK